MISAMSSIHIDATARVAAKLREQASAHGQIAALQTAVGTDDALRHATEHAETARLFTLLHAAVNGGLLDRLDTDTLTLTTAGKA